MACQGFLAQSLQFLGYADQALKASREALALARTLSHPQSLAFSFFCAAAVNHLRGEIQSTQEHAEAEIMLSTDQGLPLWLAHGNLFRGWALMEQGRVEAGSIQIHQGLGIFR